MGNPKRIGTDETEDEGIQIEYIKSRKYIEVFAWSGAYGIRPVGYSLADFCKQLGIKRAT